MEEFLEEVSTPLYRFLVRLTRDREVAADLTQESLLRAWKNRKRIREARSRRVWVFRIAVNLWKDDRRRQARLNIDAGNVKLVVASSPTPDQIAAGREMEERVASAVDALPDRQRTVLHLRIVERLSVTEIAEVLHIRSGAVRSSLSEGRKRLASLLPELRRTEQASRITGKADEPIATNGPSERR